MFGMRLGIHIENAAALHPLQDDRRAGVPERVAREPLAELHHVGRDATDRTARGLAGDDQGPPGPSGHDHGAGHVDAVDEAVAGVRHVQGVRPGAQSVLHDVRGRRLHHVAAGRGEQQQIDVERVEPGLRQGVAPGGRRQGRGVLAVPGDPAADDPGHTLEYPGRQGRPADGDLLVQALGFQNPMGKAGAHRGYSDAECTGIGDVWNVHAWRL
ncbi:hypothetical protein GCM10020000_81610 [Streptomyces olivoverticillatus]